MRIQILQHAPFEGPGHITEWAASRSYSLEVVHTYKGIAPGMPDEYDWLIVLGGPMSALDDPSWLRVEKRAIAEALNAAAAGKVRVIGICLGAQLIAHSLGSKIYRNPEKEIGWFDINFSQEARDSLLFAHYPEQCIVFHWHGESFDLPVGSDPIGSSEATAQQGFFLGENIFGFQYHMEMLSNGIHGLMKHCKKDLKGHEKLPFVQSPDEIVSGIATHSPANRRILDQFLDRLAERT
ncbi:MAG: type 1 glutamine amidotransferase [Leptospiraceae bacterium]|nr:type 1 glutamine amidotransferase [Leptospiraceae bacterium]MCB1305032.1 type 1 glutamine amidotransferase [Leptospiraceae bacterium]